MPSTRARTVVSRTRSVIPWRSASSRNPLAGNAVRTPGDTAAPPLGGRFVVAMQYQSVAGGPATGQPVDGAWVAVEPVVIAHTRSHQQRYRHRAGVHFRAERVDIGQGALTYPRDRHEQFSRHACSLPIPGFRTVKDTRTAGVYLDPDQRRTSARRLGARAMTRRRNQAPPDILARYP